MAMGVVSVTDMLSPAILPEFERAGWLFGRDVGSPQDLPEDHPAVTVLRAFGGLVVGTVGDGEACATSDIHFHGVVGKEPFVVDWERALGTTLVCVGDVHNGHGELFMDCVGRLFTNSAVHRAFGFVGPCFADGVERLAGQESSSDAVAGREFRHALWSDISCGRSGGSDAIIPKPAMVIRSHFRKHDLPSSTITRESVGLG